jgi:hypothetical protein
MKLKFQVSFKASNSQLVGIIITILLTLLLHFMRL